MTILRLKKTQKSILFLFTLLLGVANVYGQTSPDKTYGKITPHDHILWGDHLRPYSNKWKVYIVDKDGNETFQRVWTDYMQAIELNGKTYMSRTQELYSPEMELQEIWTNLFEREAMHPLKSAQLRMNGSHTYISFNENEVATSIKQPNEEAVSKTHTFDQALYDWSLYGILLSGAPMKKGWTAAVPVYTPQSPEETYWLEMEVVDREKVTTDNGKQMNTWKVLTNTGLIFWLSEKAPYVIQLELQLQNDSKMVWRMY
ncbi:hypothetical protein [Leptobacterium sp. I13]|uniref:DUF3108 domain-containing protein n=1 Tax=Leptobacterium meishanense TaxID=3128904 RepID=UPI0030EBCAED